MPLRSCNVILGGVGEGQLGQREPQLGCHSAALSGPPGCPGIVGVYDNAQVGGRLGNWAARRSGDAGVPVRGCRDHVGSTIPNPHAPPLQAYPAYVIHYRGAP